MHRKVVSIAGVAGLAVIALSAAFYLGYRTGRPGIVEEKPEPLKAEPPKAVPVKTEAPIEQRIAAESVKAETNRVAKVREVRFEDCGEDTATVAVRFSQMPRVEDILHYVTISPKVEGITVESETDGPYSWRREVYHWVRFKSANFRYRTPYTVTVKEQTPFPDGWKLEQEFRRTIQRADIWPSVSMAESGRYLPPVGDKAVAVKSANITNLACAVRYVLPENIVQLLAREERQYRKSTVWWRDIEGDSESTEEISTAPVCWNEKVPDLRPNEWSRHPIRLRYENGIVSNGVYLLSVRNGDRPESDENAPEYRLVCMTDLGLSVRQDGKNIRVWVTSLTSGRPVPGVAAKVYASSRVSLADAVTDERGEAVLTGWDTRYEPFALIVTKRDGTDSAFMAIRDSMKIDEPLPSGVRPKYLKAGECQAFVWTDRGIYRHGEKIMVHALLRNGAGNAPRPFPLRIGFEDTEEREVFCVNAVPDEYGAIMHDGFYAPENLPSGKWKIRVFTPGKDGVLLGERVVKIEEFVPPQIRVSLKNLPGPEAEVTNLVYRVGAEHLFGGPAKQLSAESLVSFGDVEFAPAAWKGFRFGDPRRGLDPNYTRLPARLTDDRGEAEFTIALQDEWKLPKAAVRMIVQGSVAETGGRPAVTRASCIVHRYPYYLGSDVPRYIRRKPGTATYRIVQVDRDGRPHQGARKLKTGLWKIEYVYNLVRNRNGSYVWDSERVRRPVEIKDFVDIDENGEGAVELPVSGSGDYEFAVEDEERGLAHCAPFWISASGDDEVRATLKNPREVAISADKPVYHEGERPRLTIKTPFRGSAWLAVMREKTLYTRVFEITNLTSVVELDPVEGAWAPNIDAAISVVQSVEAGKNHLAARAHGIVSLGVRTWDSELPVKVETSVKCADQGGSELVARILSRGAVADGERAVVTVVDEGINILTDEKVPDPIGFFSIEHGGRHPLYDLYNKLLPIYDSAPKANGAKTGGDGLAGLMNRVSPIPTRRFKPLSRWQTDIALTNGEGTVKFRLPEFVGEVRVTALVYTRRGSGCRAVQQKVCPKLVMQPDAPRFAAPGDRFRLTLTLSNRSGRDEEVEYGIAAEGAVRLVENAVGRVRIKDGDSSILNVLAEAKPEVGQGVITYRSVGCGETHSGVIELPVRPAVAWQESAEVKVLRAGETCVSTNVCGRGTLSEATRRTISVSGSPIAELVSAFDYLAEYPHGCLEQTSSRIFPLIYGGGFLNRLPSEKTSKAGELKDIVNAGIARVVSMLRQNDFTMWPDSDYAPWDREVSLYAAHFLVEAELAGYRVNATAAGHVRELLKKWAFDASTNVSAYACHTLALAGRPEKDRMFTLYDAREKLPLLSRARLARAFVRIGDPKRARELVADAALRPEGVKEAAFALLAILEMDSKDERLAELVLYLQRQRDRGRFHWGTTEGNAHALLALAAYYRTREGAAGSGVPEIDCDGTVVAEGKTHRVCGGGNLRICNRGSGEAFVSMKTIRLPEPESVVNGHNVISISRRFVTAEGFDVDLENLTRGELLIGEITLAADRDFEFSDLVIEDLFPAGLEPDRKEVAEAYVEVLGGNDVDWVLRSDIRDDRVLVFSKKFKLEKGHEVRFHYAVRVVTAGDFVLPGPTVEGMYHPDIRARRAPGRLVVRH